MNYSLLFLRDSKEDRYFDLSFIANRSHNSKSAEITYTVVVGILELYRWHKFVNNLKAIHIF